MGILFILLSVSCSLLLAHLLKLGEVKQYKVLNILTVNYVIAFGAAIGINAWNGLDVVPAFPVWFWIFCAFIGFIFIANFFVLSRSVHLNGVGVSIAAMRLALLVPVLLSVFFYGELLTFSKIAGILLVFGALFMLIAARRDVSLTKVGSAGLLLLLFFFSGMADASLKIYEEEMSAVASEAHLMSAIFMFSLLFGIAAIIKTGDIRRINLSEIKLGVSIGVPNLLSSIFLINAFAYFDASVVYSVINMLVVMGGALIGLLYWKDKVSRFEAIGMAMAVLAIIILIQF